MTVREELQNISDDLDALLAEPPDAKRKVQRGVELHCRLRKVAPPDVRATLNDEDLALLLATTDLILDKIFDIRPGPTYRPRAKKG